MISQYLNSPAHWVSDTPRRAQLQPNPSGPNQQAFSFSHQSTEPPKPIPEPPSQPNLPGTFPAYYMPPSSPYNRSTASRYGSEPALTTIYELPAQSYRSSVDSIPYPRSWPESKNPDHGQISRRHHEQIPQKTWYSKFFASDPDPRAQDPDMYLTYRHARNGRDHVDGYFDRMSPYMGGYVAPATAYHAAMEAKLFQNSLRPSPLHSSPHSAYSCPTSSDEWASRSSGGTSRNPHPRRVHGGSRPSVTAKVMEWKKTSVLIPDLGMGMGARLGECLPFALPFAQTEHQSEPGPTDNYPLFPLHGVPPNSPNPNLIRGQNLSPDANELENQDRFRSSTNAPNPLALGLTYEEYMAQLQKYVPYFHAYAEGINMDTQAPEGKKRCWVGRPVGRILRARDDDLAKRLCWLHKDAQGFANQLRIKGEGWDGMRCPPNVTDMDPRTVPAEGAS